MVHPVHQNVWEGRLSAIFSSFTFTDDSSAGTISGITLARYIHHAWSLYLYYNLSRCKVYIEYFWLCKLCDRKVVDPS
jgi:hypothetical protein